jgi:anaerobic selenocysteine-containing dehydrogenase
MRRVLLRSGPEGSLSLALATGPHGLLRGGLSLRRLRRSPHGVDLGPLESRLPKLLRTRGKKVQLAPRPFLDDLPRLRSRLEEWSTKPDELVLIGRRHLRSNNSWMHNSPSLMEGKGHPTCTLLMHPRDAAVLGLTDGQMASVESTAGRVEAPVEISDEMMPGVVSLPHGWGHHREGARLRVAGRRPGVSMNDVTVEQFVDALTGTAALSGIPVMVRPAAAAVTPQPATAGPMQL